MSMIIDGTNGLTFNNATTQVSAGVVLQVVNATYSTETSSSTSTYADTGLTATITPKFSTSKILVLVNQSGVRKSAANTWVGIQLQRNGSSIVQIETTGGYTNEATPNGVASSSTSYLDSPATTSSVTYKTQFNSGQNLATTYVQVNNTTSTITLMEIAG